MCTELREQPALSVARVEVNYFQRRLPGASIKAAPFPTLFPFHSVPLLISIRLSFFLSLPHDTRTYSHTLAHNIHTQILAKAYMHPLPHPVDSDSLLTVSHPVPVTVAAIPRHACRRGPFTNAHDYRGFVGKALGLRASWERARE